MSKPHFCSQQGVSIHAQMHSPTNVHMVAAKRILNYLHGTSHHDIYFKLGSLCLTTFPDTDWVRLCCIFLAPIPLPRLPRNQNTASSLQVINWVWILILSISHYRTCLDSNGAQRLRRISFHSSYTLVWQRFNIFFLINILLFKL